MHLQNLDYVPSLPDGFSCRHEKQIMPEQLSKRIWRTKSQSSALLSQWNLVVAPNYSVPLPVHNDRSVCLRDGNKGLTRRVPLGLCIKTRSVIALDMKMIFLSNANKTHFHKKDRALGLILKIRDFGTPKWPTGVQFVSPPVTMLNHNPTILRSFYTFNIPPQTPSTPSPTDSIGRGGAPVYLVIPFTTPGKPQRKRNFWFLFFSIF